MLQFPTSKMGLILPYLTEMFEDNTMNDYEVLRYDDDEGSVIT